MSIAQRFKELDAKLAQAPAALTAANDDSETLDRALALLRRQLADIKGLLKVVEEQKVRLAEQDKTLATLRKMYAAELAKKAAVTPTSVSLVATSERTTKSILEKLYPPTP